MLDGLELIDRPANLFRLDSSEHSDANRCENIFKVMRALQRNLSHGHDLDSFRVLKEDIAAANERSPLNFLNSAEPEDLWLETATHLRRDFVIEIQHSEIVRRLVFENTRLGRSVVLHRTMAIEVIGRDIQNDGDLRTEGLD